MWELGAVGEGKHENIIDGLSDEAISGVVVCCDCQ